MLIGRTTHNGLPGAFEVAAVTAHPKAGVPVERRAPHGSRLVLDPRRLQPKLSVAQALANAEAKVTDYLKSPFAAPSAQIAVMIDGELVYSKGLGLKNVETGEAAGADNLYGISSITKSFTSACILRLVEAGKLSLDTPVASLIPELRKAAGNAVPSLTVRQLITHTGRLSRNVAAGFWEPGKYWESGAWPTWDDVVLALPRASVMANPEKAFRYSNMAFVLLGQVVSRVSGVPYREYLREHILEPLGMTEARIRLDEESVKRLAVGYEAANVNAGTAERGVVPPMREPNAMDSMMGIRTTASDLMKWLAFLREPSRHPGVLSAKSVASMKATMSVDTELDRSFGLGLTTSTLRTGMRTVGYTGSGLGYSSAMRLTMDGGIGIVVLANEWGEQSSKILDLVAAELADVARKPPGPGAAPKDPAWKDYFGSYWRGGGKPRVLRTNADGELTFDGTALLTPVPGKADTFVISKDPGSGDNEETLFFLRHPTTGVVTHALVGGTTPETSQRTYTRAS